MRGLGEKSAAYLGQIGIHTPDELRKVGAINAYIRMQQASLKPGLNFLYALVGAIEDRSWQEVAKQEKGRLLIELEGYQQVICNMHVQTSSEQNNDY